MASLIERRKMMFGITGGWLTATTQTAIKLEFGDVVGRTIISGTNSYLNQIQDPIEAKTLANIINQIVVLDARTIYSFVPTLGVARWLEFDGNSYIATNVDVNHSVFNIESLFRVYRTQGSWDVVYGNGWGSSDRYIDAMVQSGANSLWVTVGNTEITGMQIISNVDILLEQSFSLVKVTYSQATTEYATGTTLPPLNKQGEPFRIGSHSRFSALIGRISYLKYYIDGELAYWFIPATINNSVGMIDAISGDFYGNSGSGSFQITEI